LNTELDDDDKAYYTDDSKEYDYQDYDDLSDVQIDDVNHEYRLYDDRKEGYDNDHHHGYEDHHYGYKPKKKKVYIPVFVPEKEKKKSKIITYMLISFTHWWS